MNKHSFSLSEVFFLLKQMKKTFMEENEMNKMEMLYNWRISYWNKVKVNLCKQQEMVGEFKITMKITSECLFRNEIYSNC